MSALFVTFSVPKVTVHESGLFQENQEHDQDQDNIEYHECNSPWIRRSPDTLKSWISNQQLTPSVVDFKPFFSYFWNVIVDHWILTAGHVLLSFSQGSRFVDLKVIILPWLYYRDYIIVILYCWPSAENHEVVVAVLKEFRVYYTGSCAIRQRK